MKQSSPELESAELHRRIMSKLAEYEDCSSFEVFAHIMQKAQILEFGLKSLLRMHCAVEQQQMGNWTLGILAKELERRKLRKDYISILKRFVEYRNYMAHEMLANNAIYKTVEPSIGARFEFRQLQEPAYEIEKLLILYDWCEEHDAWGLPR